MQLALTILAGFGALLFVISFLMYAVSGFRHHFVTGLISLLPVLNIVTLPSLWDKNSSKFFIGLIGLSIAIGAWFLGADKGLKNLTSNGNNSEEIVISSTAKNNSGDSSQSLNTQEVPITIKKKRSFSFNESNMSELPNKALYKMGFEVVPVNQLTQLKGRIVQITNNNNELMEGRIKSIAPGSIILDGLFENELPIASIKQIKLMVKKPN